MRRMRGMCFEASQHEEVIDDYLTKEVTEKRV